MIDWIKCWANTKRSDTLHTTAKPTTIHVEVWRFLCLMDDSDFFGDA